MFNKSDAWLESMHKRKGHGTNQFTKAKELGLPIPKSWAKGKPGTFLGKHHTKESKDKISLSMKKAHLEGRLHEWYFNKRTSKAEKYFKKFLSNIENVKSQVPIKKYILDYANSKTKKYFEIDGEQHYTKNGIAHDKERTKFLECFGWECIGRCRWTVFKRLNAIEKKRYIHSIKHKLS